MSAVLFQSPSGGSMLRNEKIDSDVIALIQVSIPFRGKYAAQLDSSDDYGVNDNKFQSPFGGSMLRNPTQRRMPLFCV